MVWLGTCKCQRGFARLGVKSGVSMQVWLNCNQGGFVGSMDRDRDMERECILVSWPSDFYFVRQHACSFLAKRDLRRVSSRELRRSTSTSHDLISRNRCCETGETCFLQPCGGSKPHDALHIYPPSVCPATYISSWGFPVPQSPGSSLLTRRMCSRRD